MNSHRKDRIGGARLRFRGIDHIRNARGARAGHGRRRRPGRVDAYPCDPSSVAEGFSPALGVHGLVQFEDFWPVALDFDFNDTAIAYNYAFKLSGDGRVSEIRATFNPRALGGFIELGLAIQLPAAAASAQTTSRTIGTGAAQNLTPWANETNLTLTLSSNMRQELFPGFAIFVR
jgi:hypothetical protein